MSGSSPFKRDASHYSSLRETRLPSNIERKQKSRISLILEENFEDESLKNEIDKLMTQMAAENMTKKVSTYLINPLILLYRAVWFFLSAA